MQFRKQEESYDKTDVRLLCGIYDEKVEDLVSDDGVPDCIDISQETEKMPELFKDNSGKTPANASPQERLLQFDQVVLGPDQVSRGQGSTILRDRFYSTRNLQRLSSKTKPSAKDRRRMYSKMSTNAVAQRSLSMNGPAPLTEGAPTPNTDNIKDAEMMLDDLIINEIVEEQHATSMSQITEPLQQNLGINFVPTTKRRRNNTDFVENVPDKHRTENIFYACPKPDLPVFGDVNLKSGEITTGLMPSLEAKERRERDLSKLRPIRLEYANVMRQ